ncbi:MAG: hypothetical protein WBJ81_03780 [Rickettsiales bacterium]
MENNQELLGQNQFVCQDYDISFSNSSFCGATENSFSDKKIVFITAIYGAYEASCKKYVPQNIPSDFICFTNSNNTISNNWEVDSFPYFLSNPSDIDDGSYLNSLKNNNHTFNLAKYFKQSFHNIPRLKNYDIVIWLDGTIEIRDPNTAEHMVNYLKYNPIVTWEHNERKGSLAAEAQDSMFSKYTSQSWLGQKQPYQDVQAQYRSYIKDGYDENLGRIIDPLRVNFGVWITCFIAFDNKNDQVKNFLDFWYLQTLNYTTQDQVSFSYATQKLHLYPYTLPDTNITGSVWRNILFTKHSHGR